MRLALNNAGRIHSRNYGVPSDLRRSELTFVNSLFFAYFIPCSEGATLSGDTGRGVNEIFYEPHPVASSS